MKNFTRILFAGALAVPVIGSAQTASTTPENRNAVVEEWTGIHCGYCPTGHAAVQAAVTNNPGDVVAINFHSGGYAVPNAGEPDYRTPEGTVHDGAFSISGYPSSTLNRRTIGGSQTYHPAGTNDADKVPAVLAEVSEVNMAGLATIDIQTRELVVNVNYYYTSNAPNATNYLNVAIVQNNVQGPQTTYGNGTYNPGGWINYPTVYNHQHMFRGFMTGQWGEAINSTTAGSTATMSYTMTLPNDINGVPLDLANIEIQAYIGDGVQSAGDILTGISVDPTLTGFTSTDEVVFASATADDIEVCDAGGTETTSPVINIQNWGSNAMTSAVITYDINGGTPQVMNWSGNLAPGSTEQVTLDPITYTPVAGSNTVNVDVSMPNGVADNTSDNSGSTTFNADIAALTDAMITVNLETDGYGDEIWMELRNGSGAIVWSEGNENVQGNYNTGQFPPAADPTNPLGNEQVYSWDIPLSTLDCYTFHIYDYYGDGLAGSAAVQGTYSVDNNLGAAIITASSANFGGDESGLVKNNSVGINELGLENLTIYPNPATEVLNVSFTAEGNHTVAISDLQGRVIATQNGSNVAFSVADMAAGSYIVTISTENGVYTENVVIK